MGDNGSPIPGGAAVAVEDLRVRYRAAADPAVDAMTFTVDAGEVFGFLGPSGAGKSTVQRVLTRLLRGFDGEVHVLGRALEAWGDDYFEHVGVGFELPAAFGRLTARENLSAFASLYRGAVADPAELLHRVGLAEFADRRAATFSKGMRMRLNLARALVNRPRLLFLDEPTSGQDPVHAAMLREVIRAEADRGATVFLTTHDMHTADRLCDRLAFVAAGRIAAIDTPHGFKLRHGRPGVVAEYRLGGRRHQRAFDLADLAADGELARLVSAGSVETLHTREATLDEVFAAVTEVRL
ncbi:fluoroquinolone transport system ATP-binding protein [Murinocardiopsis flavida]|uniref:Fluoroquinolone transport system ATP-binding protein n=1 Tax=Murinocardiopsis flavida TaxID=645275 RepID=A0A2P8DMJ2_9ACTN|nr:ABC transporter ATP-binding protein [Murinocardiopsis flavida]PSK98422.1 fluoroquinolone transport system ATP-binding protein [Murinocardiopsis flavida]